MDRRRELGPAVVPAARLAWEAVALGLVVLGGVLGARAGGTSVIAAVGGPLAAGVVVLAAVTAGLGLARWLVSGDATALWLSAALLVAGAARALALVAPSAAAGAAQAAAVALLLAVAGALGPAVDTRLRARWVLPAAGLLVAAGTGLGRVTGPPDPPIGDGALALLALAAAVLLLRRGARGGHPFAAAAGLLLLTAELGFAAAFALPPAAGVAVRDLATAAGLVLAAAGAGAQLRLGYRAQRGSLHEARSDLRDVRERLRAHRERDEERAHEARSALAAIDGATGTLERYHDRLEPGARAQLARAVQGEVRRLQRLIADSHDAVERLELEALLAPLLAVERARGTAIEALVEPGLEVAARPGAATDAVRALLDNARCHAAGTPVTVRAEASGHRVVVRVEDRGPGVPAHLRRAVFERGVTGGGTGQGLGLAIAEELARGQGGQLWVDGRPGGGASFALSLPAWSWQEPAHAPDAGADVDKASA